MTESAEAAPKPEDAEANHEELREYLECWRLPGGRLGTSEEEKAGLRESLALTRQQVPTRSLAPHQRRGHVSWVERLKGVFRP
jgi:hypothetical protein